jgi:hypothetical protein
MFRLGNRQTSFDPYSLYIYLYLPLDVDIHTTVGAPTYLRSFTGIWDLAVLSNPERSRRAEKGKGGTRNIEAASMNWRGLERECLSPLTGTPCFSYPILLQCTVID